MKYYVQMVYYTTSYQTALDPPQNIEKEEFSQRNVNEWCEDYLANDYGTNSIDINCLGFELTDEDDEVIETLFYRERRADYHGKHKTTTKQSNAE